MEIACLAEEVLNEQFGPLQKKDKNKGASSSGNNNNNNSGKAANQTQSNLKADNANGKRKAESGQQTGRDRPVCPICNRRHGGECLGNKPKCYKCG